MSKKNISVEGAKKIANDMLASDMPQDSKKGICFMVEALLMASKSYEGYNNNYWRSKGCKEWEKAGRPEGKEKNIFITGPSNEEYSRYYY